jgi:hypothetical protein
LGILGIFGILRILDHTSKMMDPPFTIHHVSFNQDNSCFAVATDEGFRIFSTDTGKEIFNREIKGGLSRIEMLYRTNLMAVVPLRDSEIVKMWDDGQQKIIGEIPTPTPVRGIVWQRERIAVVLDFEIVVYHLKRLVVLTKIKTLRNTQGLCAITPFESSFLACPTEKAGQVRMERFDSKDSFFFQAHQTMLSALALTLSSVPSLSAPLLATTSSKGTLIRIWNTATGTRLQQLRRGVDQARITGLGFHVNEQFLFVTSDKQTLHIFGVHVDTKGKEKDKDEDKDKDKDKDKDTSPPIGNQRSVLHRFRKFLPRYFSSEWSYKQLSISESARVGFPNYLGQESVYQRRIFVVEGTKVVSHEF